MYYKNEIDKSIEKITDKDIAKLAVSMRSLISMLEEKGIEDSELSEKFKEVNEELNRCANGDMGARRPASNKMLEIVLYTFKKHNLARRGTLRSRYVVIYVAIGIMAGLAMFSISIPAYYMSISIAVCAGLGLLIGTVKESKAEKEGRVY